MSTGEWIAVVLAIWFGVCFIGVLIYIAGTVIVDAIPDSAKKKLHQFIDSNVATPTQGYTTPIADGILSAKERHEAEQALDRIQRQTSTGRKKEPFVPNPTVDTWQSKLQRAENTSRTLATRSYDVDQRKIARDRLRESIEGCVKDIREMRRRERWLHEKEEEIRKGGVREVLEMRQRESLIREQREREEELRKGAEERITRPSSSPSDADLQSYFSTTDKQRLPPERAARERFIEQNVLDLVQIQSATVNLMAGALASQSFARQYAELYRRIDRLQGRLWEWREDLTIKTSLMNLRIWQLVQRERIDRTKEEVEQASRQDQAEWQKWREQTRKDLYPEGTELEFTCPDCGKYGRRPVKRDSLQCPRCGCIFRVMDNLKPSA